MLAKGGGGAFVAGATCGAYSQRMLQSLESGAARSSLALDVTLGDSVADANNHEQILMRLIRVCKWSTVNAPFGDA
jgi:hypothetical protein